MNYGRLIAGGLVAGLVLSLLGFAGMHLFFFDDFVEALKLCNLSPAPTLGTFFEHLAMRFIAGIALVWLYAAIRPRFGPGPRTALIAGLALWYLAYAHSAWINGAIGWLPSRLLVTSTAWGLLEVSAASLIGAWAYREP